MNRSDGILPKAAVASAGLLEGAGPPFLGQQVDGQRRMAGPGQPPGHRSHPVVQSLVFVNDQDGTRWNWMLGPTPLAAGSLGRPK